MNLDNPWKIAALVGALIVLRVIWGLWKQAPSRKATLELLDSGLIAFTLVFLLIRPFVVQAFYIPSDSMVPTLKRGDRILVNKFVYRLDVPQRGDIIVFDAPRYALRDDQPQADFVKRLVGLPGDEIRIRNEDGVYINGRKLQEAPGTDIPAYDWPEGEIGRPGPAPYRVPKGDLFVLGDNRNDSFDSHAWRDPPITGQPRPALEQRRVLGKAMVIFWPPQRIRLLSDNEQVHIAAAPTGPKVAQAAP